MAKQTFEEWLKQVDNEVWKRAGCSLYGLSDCCLIDWYEKGITAKRAASKAIRNAGG